MGILIKNISILTMDKENEFIYSGYVLTNGSVISEINSGEYNGSLEQMQVIDGSNKLIMPGLINCHTHAAMTLLRGYGEGLPLMRWLNEKIWPMEGRFKEEHIRAGTELAFIEMIKSGTTAFNDMYFMQDTVMKTAEEFNIRAVLGIPIIGDEWEDQLNSSEKLMGKVKEKYGNEGMISIMLAPHSPYTLTKEALSTIALEAKNWKLDIHIHVAETLDEINIIKEKFKLTPCEYLEDVGILSNKTVCAHCVHLTDRDINILKSNGASAVYNPQSNMKLASGVSRVVDMINAGVNVCLGTDGVSSNNNLNMFEEMETGSLLQKLWYKDTTILDGKTTLKLCTENGASALGIKNCGMLKQGYKADMIILDLDKPNMVPIHDVYSNLVFSANGSEVDTVIINGEIVMEHREFLKIDEEKIIYEFKKRCNELVALL